MGPGRAGRAFARSWLSAGGSLLEVIGRDRASADRAARELGGGAKGSVLDDAWSDCDLLVIAVPDDEISRVARKLAGRLRCRWVFHLSGALPANILDPLRASGASLGCLHPLRAFTGAASETWQGALVAIEADEAAVGTASRVVAALGGRGQFLSPEGKALYHAAATLAAGGSVAVLSLAVRAWVDAGLPESQARRALAELSKEAVSAAGEHPFAEAFTGPIARRDLSTVRAHRHALRGQPEALRLYALLAQETLRRTPGRGKEEEIRAILGPEG